MAIKYNSYQGDGELSRKQFNEMSTLIDMAEGMRSELLSKKKDIRKNILTIVSFAYLSIMAVIVFKFTTTALGMTDYIIQVIVLTFSFSFGVSVLCIFRIKNTMEEIKIERYALQELMEIIFNLRKVLPKDDLDVVDLTIIDLKLKRLRFH
ncbi:hypothetical protein ACDX32_26945 [Klebsiella quasipneumoniae]|nr:MULTISPECIES: hypothetical protein [Enterobacteriaceae]TRS74872.1 hypothetical protein DNP17_25000 [Salmonella enterica subsp. enterica serovar Panama]TRS75148.1 hypothetical protein DNP14_24845 [Salmonella enterica subsp. enterica serovar Panama]HBV2183747.1 hypothetical protein [Klebsiella pneumoniae]